MTLYNYIFKRKFRNKLDHKKDAILGGGGELFGCGDM
jgi:hypothetical protein